MDKQTEQKVAELTKWLKTEQLGELDLDEMVHDYKSGEASNINNGGVADQLEYILACNNNDVEQTKKQIKGTD
jgi:hypothetical protein